MRSWWWCCWDEKAAATAAAAAGTGWSDGWTGADGCFETGAGHMSQQPARMMGWARLPGPGKIQSARWGGGRALNPGLSVWSPPGCLPSPGRRRSSAADSRPMHGNSRLYSRNEWISKHCYCPTSRIGVQHCKTHLHSLPIRGKQTVMQWPWNGNIEIFYCDRPTYYSDIQHHSINQLATAGASLIGATLAYIHKNKVGLYTFCFKFWSYF